MSSEVEDPDQERSPSSGGAPQEKRYPRKPKVPSDQPLPVRQQRYQAVFALRQLLKKIGTIMVGRLPVK